MPSNQQNSEQPKQSLWDKRLSAAVTTKEVLAIYLNHGVKLRGVMVDYDHQDVLLSSAVEGGVLISRASIASIQKNTEDSKERRPTPTSNNQ